MTFSSVHPLARNPCCFVQFGMSSLHLPSSVKKVQNMEAIGTPCVCTRCSLHEGLGAQQLVYFPFYYHFVPCLVWGRHLLILLFTDNSKIAPCQSRVSPVTWFLYISALHLLVTPSNWLAFLHMPTAIAKNLTLMVFLHMGSSAKSPVLQIFCCLL